MTEGRGPVRVRATKYARVPLWLIEAGASGEAIKLYAVLIGYYGHYERVVPSQRTIADQAQKSVRTVQRLLCELEDVGALVRHIRVTPAGDNDTCEYELIFDEAHRLASDLTGGGVKSDTRGGVMDDVAVEDVVSNQTDTSDEVSTPDVIDAEIVGDDETPPTSQPAIRNDDATRLCELLADWIEKNGSKRPKITNGWLVECERLIRIDGRTPEQVQNAIAWCQQDPFWRGNILSMPKLRQRYDQLRLAAQRSGVHGSTSNGYAYRQQREEAMFAKARAWAAAADAEGREDRPERPAASLPWEGE